MSTISVTSEVSICSNALRRLGDDPITSLLDNSNRARLCNALYPKVRDSVLRDHAWNFAIKRVALAELSTTPVFGFAHQYALPSDFIRLLETDIPSRSVFRFESSPTYKIEGTSLLTDASAVNIRYVFREANTSKFDDLFTDCLTTRMTYELAQAITSKQSLSQQYWLEYQAKLASAKAVDGQDDDPDSFEDTTLVDFRHAD